MVLSKLICKHVHRVLPLTDFVTLLLEVLYTGGSLKDLPVMFSSNFSSKGFNYPGSKFVFYCWLGVEETLGFILGFLWKKFNV